MLKLIKKILVKRWAKEITREISNQPEFNTQTAISEFEDCKNIAGVGGQQFRPYFIRWNTILFQSKRYSQLSTIVDSVALKEELFFEYFGPLEHWCDENCQGQYYLWSDEHGIYRLFTNSVDDMLWNLTFEDQMPTMREIYQLVEKKI
mgnify:CR=1 FL=1